MARTVIIPADTIRAVITRADILKMVMHPMVMISLTAIMTQMLITGIILPTAMTLTDTIPTT